MSMADDNTLRSYRPNDPFRRDTAPASERDRSNDPLVELARLIGQSDPFAEIGRSNARDADARQDSVRQDSPAPPPVARLARKPAALRVDACKAGTVRAAARAGRIDAGA